MRIRTIYLVYIHARTKYSYQLTSAVSSSKVSSSLRSRIDTMDFAWIDSIIIINKWTRFF
jgi:hypothetical protein